MAEQNKPQVLLLMGSGSDHAVMVETEKLLFELGVGCDVHIASAHRTPEKVQKLVSEAEERGVKVIVAAAGLAAHLAGAVAAKTVLPVIGVPLEASPLGGLDSLLSTVQMPPGIPVATVAIGSVGAKNAAVLAAEIVALSDEQLSRKLKAYRAKMAEAVEDADAKLKD